MTYPFPRSSILLNAAERSVSVADGKQHLPDSAT